MSIKLAIFDMAGTTIDDRDEVYRVLRQAAEKQGAEIDAQTFQEHMGMEKHHALGELLKKGTQLKGDAFETAWEESWQWFREELACTYRENPPTPLEGVEEMFQTLRDHQIKIGLTTGFAREITDIILAELGWHSDSVVCGDEVPSGRPAPDMIQKTIQKLNIDDPGEVINFGDTAADIRSAQAAGVIAVGVLTGHLSRSDFEDLDAGFVLPGAKNASELIIGTLNI